MGVQYANYIFKGKFGVLQPAVMLLKEHCLHYLCPLT